MLRGAWKQRLAVVERWAGYPRRLSCKHDKGKGRNGAVFPKIGETKIGLFQAAQKKREKRDAVKLG